ncbi:MAG TPA: type II toxin-antitoxin system RelE/ParE family toxin [Allosphingosinicella sp.]|jgi:putative addiction module killer protein
MIRIEATPTFRKWQDRLRDERASKKIAIAIAKLAHGLGDIQAVGDEVSEVRINYGPGYRLYFTRRGVELIILICGGDKSSQDRDIEKAKEMASAL